MSLSSRDRPGPKHGPNLGPQERLFIHLLPFAGLVPKHTVLKDRWAKRCADPNWPRRKITDVKKVVPGPQISGGTGLASFFLNGVLPVRRSTFDKCLFISIHVVRWKVATRECSQFGPMKELGRQVVRDFPILWCDGGFQQ